LTFPSAEEYFSMMSYNIESLTFSHGEVAINGWLFHVHLATARITLEAESSSGRRQAECVIRQRREDVYTDHPGETSLLSGFFVAEQTYPFPCRLSLVARFADGNKQAIPLGVAVDGADGLVFQPHEATRNASITISDDAAQPPPEPLHPPLDVIAWRRELPPWHPISRRFNGQIGIFIHMFYDDLAGEFAERIADFPYDVRVYVSTTSEAKKAAIEHTFRAHGITGSTVKVLPNKGRDFGPFILGFADEVRRHDICLRLHSKKSTHGKNDFGTEWRQHLIRELIGDRNRVILAVESLAGDAGLGVLMAHHWPRVADGIAIGPNRREMNRILDGIGVQVLPDQTIDYPSGSMFWFRGAALSPLFSLPLTWDNFDNCSEVQRDGTIAHGLERCILFFAAKANLHWAVLPRRAEL